MPVASAPPTVLREKQLVRAHHLAECRDHSASPNPDGEIGRVVMLNLSKPLRVQHDRSFMRQTGSLFCATTRWQHWYPVLVCEAQDGGNFIG